MSPQVLLQLADFGQSLTMAVAVFAFVPQLRTIHRNKSSKNISLKAWAMWAFCSILGLFYAGVQYYVYSNCLTLLMSAVLNVALNFLALSLAYYYRDGRFAGETEPLLLDLEKIERINGSIVRDLRLISIHSLANHSEKPINVEASSMAFESVHPLV